MSAPQPITLHRSLGSLIGAIADEFTERRARGERPDVEEYARLHPDVAAVLREVLPLVVDLEPATVMANPQAATAPPRALRGAPDELPTLPGYDVLEKLGEGGMGVVFLARHRQLQRRVALKMLLRFQGDAVERRRFQVEAQAAARLSHPNIVPIFEVGEDEGRPFLAMEYVPGGSLADRLRGGPLGAREAAALVEALAGAVQAAHDGAIVHRDLKPGNVLLAVGTSCQLVPPARDKLAACPYVAKVADFGLAKRLDGDDHGALTQAGAVVGTPSYMPPEQTRGEVGPACDVYALGAILYECLTGRPPFRGVDALDTLVQVRECEPAPVRTLQPKLPRDLETICHKCLHKEAKGRYLTSRALGEDLRRFLAGEADAARPTSAVERAWKWARRHPVVAGLALALLVALAGGFAGVFAQWRRAQDNFVEARRQQQQAESNFVWAEQAVEQLLTEVSEGLAAMPHMEHMRRRLLEKALKLQQEFLQARGDDPEVRLQTARAYRRTGEIYQMLGRLTEAEKTYLHVIQLAGQLPETSIDGGEGQRLLASANYHLSRVYLTTGRHAEAGEAIRQALQFQEDQVSFLPGNPSLRLEAADMYATLATIFQNTNRLQDCEAAHLQGQAHLQALVKAFPGEPRYQHRLAKNSTEYGNLLRITRRRDKARDAHQRAIGLLDKLTVEFPSWPEYRRDLAVAYTNLARMFVDTAEYPEIVRAYERALDLYEQLTRDFPAVADYRGDLAGTYFNLGFVLKKTGRYGPSEARYRQALRAYEKLAAEYGPLPRYLNGMSMTSNNLANLLSSMIPGEQAAARFACLPVPGAGAAAIPMTAVNQFVAQSRFQEMEEFSRRSVAIRRQLVREHPEVPEYQSRLAVSLEVLGGALLLYRGDQAQAEQLYQEAVACQLAALRANPQHPTYREHMRVLYANYLERCLLPLGKHASAARVAEEMSRFSPEAWKEQSRAAACLARCAALAQTDAALAGEQRLALAQSYGDRAVELLRMSVAKGFTDLRQLENDAQFDPIRQREGFKALLAKQQEQSGRRAK